MLSCKRRNMSVSVCCSCLISFSPSLSCRLMTNSLSISPDTAILNACILSATFLYNRSCRSRSRLSGVVLGKAWRGGGVAAPGAADVAGVLLFTADVVVILLLASAGDKAGNEAGL